MGKVSATKTHTLAISLPFKSLHPGEAVFWEGPVDSSRNYSDELEQIQISMPAHSPKVATVCAVSADRAIIQKYELESVCVHAWGEEAFLHICEFFHITILSRIC